MESRFKTEVKNLIAEIWMISKKKPWYIKAIRKDSESSVSFNNYELDQLLQEGKINQKQIQMIRKEKEVELNKLEKQEALLDSARISVMNSTKSSQMGKSKSAYSGLWDFQKKNGKASKGIFSGKASVSENMSELDSKDLN